MASAGGLLPVYAAEDEDGLAAWADSLAARAAELGLPLTQPRYDRRIVWVMHEGVTVGRLPQYGSFSNGANGSSDGNDAEIEKAADILMTQRRIIDTFFRLVRMGQAGAVAMFVHKGLVSPDVTDGEGYSDGMGRQFPGPDDRTFHSAVLRRQKQDKKERERREREEKKKNQKDKSQPGGGSPHLDGNTSNNAPSHPPRYTERDLGIAVDIDPWNGATPLLAAVDAGDVNMVRALAALGADVNRMARPPNLRPLRGPHSRYGRDSSLEHRVRRTPLMLAAQQGRVAIARALLADEDGLRADDTVVAPDGQIALRLAADARHREIVDLLPSRRAGAWLRVRTGARRALHRVGHLAGKIVVFGTAVGVFFLWLVPKVVLYHVPKEILVEPAGRLAKAAWAVRRDILSHLACAARAVGRALRALPASVWDVAVDVAKLLVDLTKAAARLVGRIPAALRIVGTWIADAARTIGSAVANVAGRAVSALHTLVVAVAHWFRTATLQDVVNGFTAFVGAIFVGLPRAVWHGIQRLGDTTLGVLKTLFGCLGTVLYYIGYFLTSVVTYVPRQLGKMLVAIGHAIANAFHEVAVLFNPKSV